MLDSRPFNRLLGRRLALRAILATLGASVAGCEPSQPNAQNYDPQLNSQSNNPLNDYHFAVHPLHNPSRLFDLFQPLMDYLNQQLPQAHFHLEASRDYAAFEEKLAQGQVEFALPNPYQTLQAIQSGHYQVFAKMGDDHNFRGIILVRADSPITEVRDLKGKTISYPAPTALAATMMPQYFLYQHGLDIQKQTQSLYVGSQESAIMNVLHGEADAGATWPPPWELLTQQHPEIKRQLRVQWQTDPLPNNSLVARKDLPRALVLQVQKVFSELHQHPQGQAILHGLYLSKFEVANDQTYQPVERFLNDFRSQIRDPSSAQ
ncbi:MAG: phosphate/phosphite/phosphonate ABC transporter substrate-binding protein [Thiotrichales bacterium]|nr:phosphate/phosphite/phosphonate ABC transporter substrate-binding protein [Thiotrichales bacterium]